jgi:general secretion pathway protein A
MYEAYWRLKRKPFENVPDPRFFYYSPRHEEALSRMLYVVRERKGAALLTGEYGSGKTLLTRVLRQELNYHRYQTAIIFNPMLPPLELLNEIVRQLSGQSVALTTKSDSLHKLNEVLYRNSKGGKNTIVVIDEAQSIEELSVFEELRLLLNFQLNDAFLLTLILAGQPELKEKIKNLPQLRQRLAVRYHLSALSPEETKAYILHRLSVAEAAKKIFSDTAFSEIYKLSFGIPRTINNLCDMALLVGCSKGMDRIDEGLIREVAEDLEEQSSELGVV